MEREGIRTSVRIRDFLSKRNVHFVVLVTAALLLSYPSLNTFLSSSRHWEYNSHMAMIPIVSAYLIYERRKAVFSDNKYSFRAALPLLVTSCALYLAGLGHAARLSQNDLASVLFLSLVIFVVGSFILFYGTKALRAATFPLLFLLLMVPVPDALMDAAIRFLQAGSTEIADVLFMMSGISYLRDGFVFHLPGQSIEVAPQCSGIHSGLALLITAVLAGQLFLTSPWKKIILAACVIPMTIFKNGIRIATLSIFSAYFDPKILQSSLHREGGVPFFIVALLLMAPVLFLLRQLEKKDPPVRKEWPPDD